MKVSKLEVYFAGLGKPPTVFGPPASGAENAITDAHLGATSGARVDVHLANGKKLIVSGVPFVMTLED